MQIKFGTEMRDEFRNMELAKGALKLVRDVMLAKPGESVVITYDAAVDERVVKAVVNAAYIIDSVPVMIYYPLSGSFYADPPAPVAGAIANADVWIEFAYASIMHGAAYRKAVDVNGARYINLTGMDTKMMVECIANVDYDKVIELGEYFKDRLERADEVIIKTKNGTDLRAYNRGRKVRHSGQKATKKGYPVMLCGQTSWCPVENTIEGILVFDGALFPPEEIGELKNDVVIEIEKGRVVNISGEGRDAKTFKSWLESFNDPNMFRLAHYSQGFNPGVKRITGRIVEDERVFGCMEFGIGSQGIAIGGEHWNAASHTDGVVLYPTIILDGETIEQDGIYLDATARTLARDLGVAGY